MRKEETASIIIVSGLAAVIVFGFISRWWITDSVSTNALYAIIIAATAILLWGFAKRIDEAFSTSHSSA